jgi:maleate isomerase
MSETASPRRAIGLIVPSSNRVVERVASLVLARRPDVDCCIARVPYGGILAEGGAGYQFEPFDRGALLLADAGVDAICWNATRGAVLGFAVDRELCRRIGDNTGIPAVTTALATIEILLGNPEKRVGLITQGDEAESLDVVRQFRSQGAEIVDHLWLGIANNLDAAYLGGNALLREARTLANRSSLDTVLIWSTNLSGYAARLAADDAAGFAILDSAEIGLNAALASADARHRAELPIK